MSLRVKLHENGEVTLSGIRFSDIKSILTSASLHHYDNPFKPQPEEGRLSDIIAENNADGKAWHENQHKLINWISKQLDEQITGKYKNKPKTKADRLAKVIEERKERMIIEEVFQELMLKAAQRKENAVT